MDSKMMRAAAVFQKVGIIEVQICALVNQKELDELSEHLEGLIELQVEGILDGADDDEFEITINVDELEDGDED